MLEVNHLTSTPRPRQVWVSTQAQAWLAPRKGSDHWGWAWGSRLPSVCTPGTDLILGTKGRCSPPSWTESLSGPGKHTNTHLELNKMMLP